MTLTALKLTDDTAPEPDEIVSAIMRPVPDIAAVAKVFNERVGQTLYAEKHKKIGPTQDASSNSTVQIENHGLNRRLDSAVQSIFARPLRLPRLSLEPLQEWEGYVSTISEDRFTARLIDITAGKKREEEFAEFPISDLSDSDRDLLKEGAVFRWVIGYLRAPGGSKRRVSQITFRRMPAWSSSELKSASLKAENYEREIRWE